MKITTAMVKELREETGAGILDCKNALQETDGDPVGSLGCRSQTLLPQILDSLIEIAIRFLESFLAVQDPCPGLLP